MKKPYKHTILVICCSLSLFVCSNTDAQNSSNTPILQTADSLYQAQNWKAAKQIYAGYLKDTSLNSVLWNRLGYCNYNLGMYDNALKNYQTALANKPSPQVRGSATARMSRVFSMMNKTTEAGDWLVKTAATGYNVLPDIDTVADYKNIRQAPNFKAIKQKVYETLYPCSTEPHSHDFDFWIGEWVAYRTGTNVPTGQSSIQSIAGSCAVMENFTSNNAYSGKSFNYYDAATGKWEQDWLGSGGQADRQRYYNGEYKDGAMNFTSESVNPQGVKIKGRFRFFNIDKDTVRQFLETSTDGGKTYTPSYDITYVRKKG